MNFRIFSLIALIVFVAAPLYAQSGKVLDNVSLQSKILKSERKFAIYLPPDYETSQRSYPVLYLLHGSGDDQTGWVQFGEVGRIADEAIRNGKATPMIIVMPDAHTGQRGYFNNVTNRWRYEDYFFKELIPHVESTYRIKGEKRFRAVAGLSMGGGGSFVYALHHPEMFSSACPLSASTGSRSLEGYKKWLAKVDKEGLSKATDEMIEAHRKRHSVLELLKLIPDKPKKSSGKKMPVKRERIVRWYIDCGDDDFLYEGNSLVHIAMRKKKIPHEFRIHDGGHNWTYWRAALPSVLEFVTSTFHQH